MTCPHRAGAEPFTNRITVAPEHAGQAVRRRTAGSSWTTYSSPLRDYQHRARLAAIDRSQQRQWLALPTHLPHGRATIIREARLVDSVRFRRCITHILSQHYLNSPFWPTVRSALVGRGPQRRERADHRRAVKHLLRSRPRRAGGRAHRSTSRC
nr:WbqC family protein [Streptomyces violens]